MDTITPEFDKLYCAYRRAKAHSDLAFYTTDGRAVSLPDDVSAANTKGEYAALSAVLRQPAANARELALKLEVYLNEEIYDAFRDGRLFTAILAADAHRIAYP